MEKVEGQLTAWVYPKEEGRSAAESYSLGGFSSSWTPKFVLSGNNNYYYAANLTVSESWQRGVSYIDGLGREIQSQQLGGGGEETIVSGVIYDERGNPQVSARPISMSNMTGFVDDLFTGGSSFTPGNELSALSPISDYYYSLTYNSEADFAYSFTEYEASPLNRVSTTRMPGGEDYSVITDYDVVDTPQEQFAFSSGALSKTTTTDPEGGISITYIDGWGRTVASGVDMNQDGLLNGVTKNSCQGASCDLITEFDYDELGNVIESRDPRGLSTTYEYNTLGQLVKKKLPDQDESHSYCYDDAGRLRFHRDPNQKANVSYYYGSPQYDYHYTKYDKLGRVTETGVKDGLGSYDTACDFYSNSQNYPSSYHTPTAYYWYDGEQAYSGASNTNGRLTKVKYLESKNGYSNVWGYTWYSYNELGLVEWIVQDLPNLSAIKITYAYDEHGRQTKLGYNVTNSANDHYFWYEYDGLGRLETVYSHTDSNPNGKVAISRYTYLADGSVKQHKLGNVAQTMDYTYDVRGWMDKINHNNTYYYTNDEFGLDLDYSLAGNIVKQKWEQGSKKYALSR